MAILSLCFEFFLYPWHPWFPCDLQEHSPVLRRGVSALYLLCDGQTPSVCVCDFGSSASCVSSPEGQGYGVCTCLLRDPAGVSGLPEA